MAGKDHDTMRDVLNRLTLKPRMKEAARNAGIHPTTLFGWMRNSAAGDPRMVLTWLGQEAPFHKHVVAARRLSVVAMDHVARDLAINGHTEPRFHNGKPVWRRDPQIEADALALEDEAWKARYGNRPRSDTFLRDETGGLIQEVVVHPPNPAMLVKLLAKLAPEVYGDRSTVAHVHSGSVWIEGSPAPMAAPAGSAPVLDGFTADFGLAAPGEQLGRATNILALPRPCATSEEFDKRFGKKLVREVTLFHDADGKLLPPLPDDVVVAGTLQARAFEDAGIDVKLVRAETLIDEGFENEFLFALAPTHKRKVRPQPKPAPLSKEAAAKAAAAKIPAEPRGKASARYDSENLGYGVPKPGGYKIKL